MENLGFRQNFTVDENDPEPLARCDGCGFHVNLNTLRPQLEWAGEGLRDTGLMKCPRCWDKPNPQLRTIVLKPDPEPARDPRPDDDAFDVIEDVPFDPATVDGV